VGVHDARDRSGRGLGRVDDAGIFAGVFRTAGQDSYTSRRTRPARLAGLAIALVGALGLAAWAAVSTTTTALRAE
jgi:hypothetical protein